MGITGRMGQRNENHWHEVDFCCIGPDTTLHVLKDSVLPREGSSCKHFPSQFDH